MKLLLKSLQSFKKECPELVKDKQGHGYTYATLGNVLEVVNPLLEKNNLIVTTGIENDNMIAMLHHLETEATLQVSLKLPLEDLRYTEVEKTDKNGEIYTKMVILGFEGMNRAQAYGSLITYFRRYTISVLLDLISETDTDGGGKEKSDYNKKSYPTKKEDELTPDGKQKGWLNEKDIDKVVIGAKEKGFEAKDLRKYYKISKDNFAILETKMEDK